VNLFNPTTSSKCVCVWSPTFFLLLYKIDIMRNQVLTLALNQPRKVFFFISYKRDGNYLFIYGIFKIKIQGMGQTLVMRLPSIHHCIYKAGWLYGYHPRFKESNYLLWVNFLDAIFRRVTEATLFVMGNTTSTWEVSEGLSFPPRFSDVPFIDIFASALLLFPTLTYTTFTLKTLKG